MSRRDIWMYLSFNMIMILCISCYIGERVKRVRHSHGCSNGNNRDIDMYKYVCHLKCGRDPI